MGSRSGFEPPSSLESIWPCFERQVLAGTERCFSSDVLNLVVVVFVVMSVGSGEIRKYYRGQLAARVYGAMER